MGWSDRVGNIVGGLFGAGKAVVGIAADLATANWNADDDFDGFNDGLRDMFIQRAATFGTELFGVSEEGPGRGLAGVPGVTGSLEGFEHVGREFIREPLTALVTATSGEAQEEFGAFADIPIVGGVLGSVGALVSGKVSRQDWDDAYEIAQSRSIGQALIIGLSGKNPWDERDVAELMGTGWFSVASGTVDAVGRFFGDVDVIAGKALAAGRLKHLVRPLDGGSPAAVQRQIDAFFTGEGAVRGSVRATWRDVNGFIEDAVAQADDVAGAAGHVRRRLFDKTDPYGAAKASLLVNAPDATTRAQVMRYLMGDARQMDAVESYYKATKEALGSTPESAALGGMLAGMRDFAISEALTMRHTDSWVADLSQFIVRNDDELLSTLDDEIAFATRETKFLENLKDTFAQQGQEVRVSRMGDVKDFMASSKVYQGPMGKPVRVFTEMRPHAYVNLNQKGMAEEQVARMMVDARLPLHLVDEWKGKMAAADGNPGARFQVWLEAEQAALHHIVDDLGIGELSLDDARRIAAHAEQGHTAARQVLNGQRAYGPNEAGMMRWVANDGTVTLVPRPMARTQVVDGLATTDFRAIRQALYRYQADGLLPKLSAKGAEKMRLPTEVLNGISYYWKASQLLRPGWTFRVVLMDEQLRRFAKFGASMSLMQTGKQFRGLSHAFIKNLELDTAAGIHKQAKFAGGVTGAAVGLAVGGPVAPILGYAGGRLAGHVVGSTAGQKLAGVLNGVEDAGYKFTIGNREFDPFDNEGIYRDQLTQSREIKAFLEPETARLMEQMQGQWGTVRGADRNHADAWSRVMSRQVMQDPLWRQALDPNGSPEQMLEWLRTAEGRRYLNDIPWRSGQPKELHHAGRWVDADPETWVQTLYEQARGLVRHDDELAARLHAAAVGDSVTDAAFLKASKDVYDDMVKRASNVTELPDVHGEILAQLSGRSEIFKSIDQTIQKGFRYLGGLPTDNLSRNPTFAMFFEEEMRRVLKAVPEAQLTDDMLRRFEKGAREQALTKTRHLMYDLAERSQFDDLARFIVPFAPAGREVLSRWMGLIIENPAVLARARQAWQAPDKLGDLIQTDDEGNEWVTFRVPEFARGLLKATPFGNALDSAGTVKFSKDAFATVPLFGDNAAESAMQGLFGFGPFVQLAVGKVVEARPDLEQAAQLFTPYGIPKDTPDAFLPAYLKRARSAGMIPGLNSGTLDARLEDRAYASMFYNIMKTHITEMNLGDRELIDFDDEVARAGFIATVKREADEMAKLRMFATYLLPIAPTFESPFAPLVEEYQRLKDNEDFINQQRVAAGKAPATAEQLFYEMHGREYSTLVQSTSLNNSGIPATGAGFTVSQKHKNLLTRYPELGGLIVGVEGGGTLTKFSAAMYQHQLKNETFEGSGKMQRERLAPDEFLTNSDEASGWAKYRRVMDLVEAERQRRGLPNLQVKGAADLAALKQRAVAAIEEQNPAWAAARATFDRSVWGKRMEGLAAVVSDRQLSQRQDTKQLKQYLKVRESMLQLLAQRRATGGASTLQASSNQDLAQLWETAVGRMLAGSPTFVDLYYRWLEGDPMTLDTALSRKAA